MATINKKHEILDSIASLDHAQTLKVLEFIRVLVENKKEEKDYEKFKKEALSQISLALQAHH